MSLVGGFSSHAEHLSFIAASSDQNLTLTPVASAFTAAVQWSGCRLRESGFLGVAEMLGRLDLNGGRIVEFPAVLEVRLFGISKMKTAHTILGHFKLLSHLIKMRWFRKTDAIKPSLAKEKLKIVSENSSE